MTKKNKVDNEFFEPVETRDTFEEEAPKMVKTIPAFVSDKVHLLNVRDDYNGKIIDKIESGTYVEILFLDGPWCNILYGEDKYGYVMTEYLDIHWES